MTLIEVVVTTLAGSSVLLGVLAWLLKSLMVHFLNKDIEVYKAAISNHNAIEIERLKYELERISNEHKVKFETLHLHRKDVIAELYSRIVDFYNAIDDFAGVIYLCDDYTIEEESNKLWHKVVAFKSYAEKNRIYFSEEICNLLDKMYDVADKPISKLMVSAEYQNIDKDGKTNLHKSWDEVSKSLENEIKQIRKIIENEFRNIAGIGN